MDENNTAQIKLELEGDKQISAKINDLSSEMMKFQYALKGVSLAFVGINTAAQTTVGNLAKTATAASRMDAALIKSTGSANAMSAAFGKMSSFTYNSVYVAQFAEGVAAAAGQLNQIPQALRAMEASGVSTQSFKQLEGLSAAIGGNKQALEGFVDFSVAKLNQFEQAAARSATIMKSVVNFDANGNAKRVNQQEAVQNAVEVQNLVNTTLKNRITSGEALNAQYQIVSGGFTNKEDSQKVLEAVGKLTAIGRAGGQQSSSEDNALALSKTLSAYGQGADQAAKFAAVINATVENGLTTIPELASNFGAVGNSANKAGISVEQLGAATATLTSQGTNTAEALTGISRLSDNIISKTPQAEEALSKLSLNGQSLKFDKAEVEAKGLAQALQDVYKATGNSTEALKEIFPETLSFRTAIGLLSKDGEKFKANVESVSAANADTLSEVADIAGGDRLSKMQALSNQFSELVITIGQSLAPIIEPGLNALKDVANAFASIPAPIKAMVAQWLIMKVQGQAMAGAVGELVKMMQGLLTTYLQGRLLSLALTGQLGNQVGIITQLITQKKGLISVMAQIIGLDQKYRLSSNQTTDALGNQVKQLGLVEKAQSAFNKARDFVGGKATGIINQNIAGYRAASTDTKVGEAATGGQQSNIVDRFVAAIRNNQTVNAVSNSNTAKTIRTGTSDFLDSNPNIRDGLKRVGTTISAIGDDIKKASAPIVERVSRVATEAATVATTSAATIIRNQTVGSLPALTIGYDDKIRAAANTIADTKFRLDNNDLIERNRKASDNYKLIQDQLTKDIKTSELQNKYAESLKEDYWSKYKKHQLNIDNLDASERSKAEERLVKKYRAIEINEKEIQKTEDRISKAQIESDKVKGIKDDTTQKIDQGVNQYSGRYQETLKKEDKLSDARQELADIKRQRDSARQLSNITQNDTRLSDVEVSNIRGRYQYLETRVKAAEIAEKALALEVEQMRVVNGLNAARSANVNRQVVNIGGREASIANSGLEKILYTNVSEYITKGVDIVASASTKAVGVLVSSFNYIKSSFANVFSGLGDATRSASKALWELAVAGAANVKAFAIRAAQGGSGIIRQVVQNIRTDGLGQTLANGARALATGVSTGYMGAARAIGTALLPGLSVGLSTAAVAVTAPLAAGLAVIAPRLIEAKANQDAGKKIDDIIKPLDVAIAKQDLNKELNKVSDLLKLTGSSKITDNDGRVSKIGEKRIEASSLGGLTATLNKLNVEGNLSDDKLKSLKSTIAEMGKNGVVTATQLTLLKKTFDDLNVGDFDRKAQGIFDRILNAPEFLFKGTVDNTGKILNGIQDNIGSYFAGKLDGGKAGRENRTADLNRSLFANDEGGIGSIALSTKKLTEQSRLASQAMDVLANKQIILTEVNGVAQRVFGDDTKELTDKLIKNGEALSSVDLAKVTANFDTVKTNLSTAISGNDESEKVIRAKLTEAQQNKDVEAQDMLNRELSIITKNKEVANKQLDYIKKQEEILVAYNNSVLPAIKAALLESVDPKAALDAATANADKQYQQVKDKKGNDVDSPYLKDIGLQRKESQTVVEKAIANTSFFAGSSRESEANTKAIELIKKERDKTVTINGVSGFVNDESIRKQYAEQILAIENKSSADKIKLKTIEADKLKSLVSRGVVDEFTASQSNFKNQQQISALNLESKEKELLLNQGNEQKFAEATIERDRLVEEQKRIGAEITTAQLRAAEFERAGDSDKAAGARSEASALRLQSDELTKGIDDAGIKVRQNKGDQEKAKLNREEIAKIKQDRDDADAANKKSLEDRVTNLKLASLDIKSANLQLAKDSLTIGALDAANQNLALVEQRSAIELAGLRKQKSLLGKGADTKDIDNKIKLAEVKAAQAKNSAEFAQFEAEQNQLKATLDNKFNEKLAALNTINKKIESAKSKLDLSIAKSNAEKDKITSAAEIQEQKRGNVASLTNDAVIKAKLDTDAAVFKLSTLSKVQAFEKESLINQQRSAELSFQKQKSDLASAKLNAQKELESLKIKQNELDLDESDSPEFKAKQKSQDLQVKSANDNLKTINDQTSSLKEQEKLNKEINNSALSQLSAKQKETQIQSEIAVRLSKVAEYNAKIDESVTKQGLLIDRQVLGLTASSQQLTSIVDKDEQRSALLGKQKESLTAITDAQSASFNLAKSLTTNKDEVAKMDQIVARNKLTSLISQISLERQILELNIKQQQIKASIDTKKLEIDERQNARSVKAAEGEFQKTLNDPRSTTSQRESAKLKLEELQLARESIQDRKGLLAATNAGLELTASLQRQAAIESNKARLDQATVDVAKTRTVGIKDGIEANVYTNITTNATEDQRLKTAQSVLDRNNPLNRDQNSDLQTYATDKYGKSTYATGKSNKAQSDYQSQIDTANAGFDGIKAATTRPDPIKLPQLELTQNTKGLDKLNSSIERMVARKATKVETPTDPTDSQPVTVNMTNTVNLSVADSTEGATKIQDNVLGAFEQVLRLTAQNRR